MPNRDPQVPAARARAKSLRLYVKAGCPACPAATALLRRAAESFEIDTRVVDLGLSWDDKPEAVFAVPTFTLDGRVVSLGTPTWDALSALLSGPGRGEDR